MPRAFLPLIIAAAVTVEDAVADGFRDQFIDPLDGHFDASQYLTDNAFGFLPVPIIISEPAVDGGFGMAGLFFHESEEEKEARQQAMQKNEEDASAYLLPPSISAGAVAVTGNNSWMVGGGHMGFYFRDPVRYVGYGGYGDFNMTYYGSDELPFNFALDLNSSGFLIAQKLKFRMPKSKLFFGFSQNYSQAKSSPNRLDDLLGSILPPGTPPELEEELKQLLTFESTNSGLGLEVEYDSRNSVFSPRKGYNYTLSHKWFSDSLGGDFSYQQSEIEGLNYWPISDSYTIALRVAAERLSTDGLIAPYLVPFIDLRGVPANRYQGDNVVLSEVEGTWHIDRRWSLLAFVGAGRATDSASNLGSSPSRVSKGIGFRYNIARRYNFNMGIDVARGPEETAFYIQAGSSW